MLSSVINLSLTFFGLGFGLRLLLPSTMPLRSQFGQAAIAGAGLTIGIWAAVYILFGFGEINQ